MTVCSSHKKAPECDLHLRSLLEGKGSQFFLKLEGMKLNGYLGVEFCPRRIVGG